MPFERGNWMRGITAGVLALSLTALGACSSTKAPGNQDGGRFSLNPFGGGKSSSPASSDAPAIGVNGFLWRATLDTLSFMPLVSADPYGGVVITDWYINPEKTDERFKCTVYILDSRLRADGLNVAVFKQAKDPSGNWVDVAAAPQTETDIENAILTKARQLRLSNVRG
ncbi:MAG: hypothetical protein CFE28_01265 [Alphaproteobacteria bacterium PA2]|nr:MAG: hypothetical protein CFE28_01265 [Alphaproteobacteria bacterium PA2]